MRILLITIPRSGSVSLLLGLSKSLSLDKVGEPFNKQLWKETPNIDKNNVVVKTFIDQISDGCKDNIKFYKKISKKFDKIILVSRKNLKEAAESYSYHNKHSTQEGWMSRYYFNDNGLDVEHWYNWFNILHSDLEKLSKELEMEIDWYEDIFSGNSSSIDSFLNKHSLTVDKKILLDYLNPKNKYRQTNPIII